MVDKKIPLPDSNREQREGATVIGSTDPNSIIEVTVLLKPLNPLEELASGSHLDSDLSKRKYLSPEEVAARYGADSAHIKAVEKFAADHKLEVKSADQASRTVTLRGTAAELKDAFDVTLMNYQYADGNYRGRVGSVHIPENLDGIVEAVFGLDNRRMAKRRNGTKEKPDFSRQSASGERQNFTALEIAKLYNFPEGSGKGQTIACLEFQNGYFDFDIQQYFKQIKISQPKITDIGVDGASNTITNDTASLTEITMDLEVAGSIAPKAEILACFAPWTEQGWVDSLTKLLHREEGPPSVISISWGFAEGNNIWTPQAMKAINQLFMTAAAMGVTVIVASGDDGARDQMKDGLHVDFPASSPYVLAAGGTSLSEKDGKITEETVWNGNDDAHGASGGGFSTFFDKPAWQQNADSPILKDPKNTGRGVPDIAGYADSKPGVMAIVGGDEQSVGGTSVVAPLLGGLIALINQRIGKNVGFINPKLYSLGPKSKTFNDIIKGDNNRDPAKKSDPDFPAAPGWDASTGWGSLNGKELLQVFQNDMAGPVPTPPAALKRAANQIPPSRLAA